MKKAFFLILVLVSLIILGIRLLYSPLGSYFGFEKKAGIKVMSNPADAEIFIDDRLVGKTPFEDGSLIESEKIIKVTNGEATWEGRIKLIDGTWTVVNRELFKDPEASSGEILNLERGQGVTIVSSPHAAEVEIDNKFFGKTPLHVNIAPGDHSFVISHSDYLKRSIRASLPKDYNLSLNVDLALKEVDLKDTAPTPITTLKVRVLDTPTNFLRVRDKPTLIGVEVGRVTPGEELTLIEEIGSWSKVRLSNGKEGYVSSIYIEKILSAP